MKEAELHIFCDTSSKAYTAATYWRFTLSNGSFHTALILSNSRVGPVKRISIPRLELQAAVLAIRVSKLISDEHNFKITRKIFWSDSTTLLNWLIKKNPQEFKVFAANRLAEINECSNVSEWKWVPTKENPADDTTRYTPSALLKNSRWFLGPSFFRGCESEWPKQMVKDIYDDDKSEFIKNKNIISFTSIQNTYLIDFSRLSSWLRLLSTVVRVLNAVDIWKNRNYSPSEQNLKAEYLCFQ